MSQLEWRSRQLLKIDPLTQIHTLASEYHSVNTHTLTAMPLTRGAICGSVLDGFLKPLKQRDREMPAITLTAHAPRISPLFHSDKAGQ